MQKNLLVTLADENYIDQAKQLFSSVYFNAGWRGDYLLLAYKIKNEKLKWFKDKGILIKECDQILENYTDQAYPPVVYSKLLLFKEEFKRWKQIIYLDADIIVRGSIDYLTTLRSFHAVEDMSDLKEQSVDQCMDLMGKAFCSGIMSFGTQIIKNNTFEQMQQLCKQYQEISVTGEQLALNVYFYKKWKKLPVVYGLFVYKQSNAYRIQSKNLKAIILHFASKEKPWNCDHYFNVEWRHNLLRADSIDLQKPQKGQNWGRLSIFRETIYLKYRYFVYNLLDRYIGLGGIYLRKFINFDSKY